MKSQRRIKRGLSQTAARCATSKLLFGGGSSSVPGFWDQTKTGFHASWESSENMATWAIEALQPHGLFVKCHGGERKKRREAAERMLNTLLSENKDRER